jgi:hypothetical protein
MVDEPFYNSLEPVKQIYNSWQMQLSMVSSLVKHFPTVAEHFLSAENIWIFDETVANNCPVIKRGDQRNH